MGTVDSFGELAVNMGDALERESFHTKTPKTFGKIMNTDVFYILRKRQLNKLGIVLYEQINTTRGIWTDNITIIFLLKHESTLALTGIWTVKPH